MLSFSAAPTGGPVGLEAVPSSTSLQLSWSPPEPQLRNGEITSYTISCSSSSSSSPSTDTTSVREYTVTGLSPNTEYTCSVRATNSAGTGPPETVTATTLEDGRCERGQGGRERDIGGS